MMGNPYVIFVGHTADNLQPFESAPNERSAIEAAQQLQTMFQYTETVYMPEDDVDTNEVVYSNRR